MFNFHVQKMIIVLGTIQNHLFKRQFKNKFLMIKWPLKFTKFFLMFYCFTVQIMSYCFSKIWRRRWLAILSWTPWARQCKPSFEILIRSKTLGRSSFKRKKYKLITFVENQPVFVKKITDVTVTETKSSLLHLSKFEPCQNYS